MVLVQSAVNRSLSLTNAIDYAIVEAIIADAATFRAQIVALHPLYEMNPLQLNYLAGILGDGAGTDAFECLARLRIDLNNALEREFLAEAAGGGAAPVATLTATTVSAGQTLTIQRLTPTEDITLDWGDGDTTLVVAGRSTAITHIYASAGAYTITIPTPTVYTHLDLRDAKLSVSGVEISKMVNLTYMYLQSLSGLSWTVGASAPMPTGLTYLYLNTLSGLSWTVGVGAPMPTGITQLYLISLTGLTSVDAGMATINAIRTLRIENNLNAAALTALIDAIYANRANYTWTAPSLDIAGGGNASPGGTYQAQCPPTTDREKIYELVNDSCLDGFNKWTVAYTA